MLGKLIKYEFKATRKMLMFYGLLFMLAAMMAVMLRFDINANGDLFVGAMWREARFSGLIALFASLIIAAYAFMNAFIFAAVIFGGINRFRLNILGNQGYLMHTLPVKAEYHILAKNIVSIIWTILGVIAALISYMIIGVVLMDDTLWDALPLIFSTLQEQLVFSVAQFWLVFAEVIVLVIVSISELYFRIYASMAVGYSFNKHRAAASVGAFIVLGIAESTLNSIFLSFINTVYIDWKFLLFTIISSAIFGTVYYFIAAWFLNNRLNLQ